MLRCGLVTASVFRFLRELPPDGLKLPDCFLFWALTTGSLSGVSGGSVRIHTGEGCLLSLRPKVSCLVLVPAVGPLDVLVVLVFVVPPVGPALVVLSVPPVGSGPVLCVPPVGAVSSVSVGV